MEQYTDLQVKKYDFGDAAANEAHYGSPTPPVYDLGRLDTKIAAFYGTADLMVHQVDAEATLALLTNAHFVEPPTAVDGYGHGDFIWATNAATTIYSKILALVDAHAAKVRLE